MTPAEPIPFRRWGLTAVAKWDQLCTWRWRRHALLAAIMLGALALRLTDRHTWYWIDEGLSLGISDRSPAAIWRVLRQDGSPPLYYLILSGWTRVFGASPAATHLLSTIFALGCIPAALLVTWRAARNERAAWIAAALSATIPYLEAYANETRMYSLVALETFVLVGGIVEILRGATRRGQVITAVSTAALLYTHSWSLYLLAGLAVAGVGVLWLTPRSTRLTLARAVAAAVAVGAVTFVPWVPTLLGQASDTGAPWSATPGLRELVNTVAAAVGDERALVVLALVGGTGLVRWLAPGDRLVARWCVLFGALATVPLLLAWIASHIQPQWALRYLAVIVAPLVILAGIGLARAGNQGLVATLVLLSLWVHPFGRLTGRVSALPRSAKSNVTHLAHETQRRFGPAEPSDTIVVTHPEQLPLVAREFGNGYRVANEFGVPADDGVFDWRNVVERLSATDPATSLKPLLDSIEPERYLVLLQPQLPDPLPDPLPEWLSLFKTKAIEWKTFVDADRRFSLRATYGKVAQPANRTPLTAYVYQRQG